MCSGNDAAYISMLFDQFQKDGCYQIVRSVREKWKGRMVADWADQKEAGIAIANIWQQYQYLLDPHTAVAYAVLKKLHHQTPAVLD